MILSLLVVVLAAAAPAGQRTLTLDDLYSLKDVGDPRISPDGEWVAYTVRRLDREADARDTDIFMAPFGGGEAVRLTASPKSETAPRFSPDGRHLAFLSSREGGKQQVWLLDRRGGDAVKLTSFKGGVSDLAWSPDSRTLALIVSDPDPDEPDDDEDQAGSTAAPEKPKKKKAPAPIVIRRLQFKQDEDGYLTELRSHVHVFDVQTRSARQLTSGPYDDSQPAWSPDGRWIAFTSNRTADADANVNTDVFLVAAAGGEPRALTSWPGSDSSPVFSPDGTVLAYLAGGNPKDLWYGTNHLAVVPVAGGPSRALTSRLDRNVEQPHFTPDGRALVFLIEDGGNRHLGRVAVVGGNVERLLTGERDLQGLDVGARGQVVVLESQPHQPAEVAALDGADLRRISRVNDAFLAGIRLAPVQRFKAKSADGTTVDGFLTLPPDAPAGQRLPAVLRIHGGPVAQFSTEFEPTWQLLAAHGYAVIAANPRGSSGYGTAFSRAIWADWGNKDYEDVMAAVEHVVAMGVADPERLGVGGWSYGGILTDYVIAKTDRFKAAVSGAGMANHLAGYGTDQYQYWWETELGLPWRNADLWLRLSPFFQVEKVKTPTLFVCGAADMNVPLLASEQLYQALRRLGVPTELVIYPDEKHEIKRPSYLKDRYERYLAWYDRYLRPERAAAPAAAAPPPAAPQAVSLLGRPLQPPDLDAARRQVLEANLARATEAFVRAPDDADAIIWLGRRLAYLGRYREAIAVFSRGIEKHPADIRLYRHRGHRYITVRELDKAVADLSQAARLIEERSIPDQVEPDGDPNPQNVPTSTSHFNVFYHLGLAHYLKGDFERALQAYQECMKYSRGNPDRLVATSDWLYMTLRRLGRPQEAAAVLTPITKDLDVIENHVYRDRLLFYKGEKTADELLGPRDDAVDLATYGYGVANWYLYNRRPDRARELFERIVQGPQWPAFGFIAAEVELARMR